MSDWYHSLLPKIPKCGKMTFLTFHLMAVIDISFGKASGKFKKGEKIFLSVINMYFVKSGRVL